MAPPRRLLGMYIGRDGPPGYNYYAPPEFLAFPDFVAMGYWKAGDIALLNKIEPLMLGLEDSDWVGILGIMRQRLKKSLGTLY